MSNAKGKREYPIKKYKIWIGRYHFGQGSLPSTKPELVGTIKAPNFRVACLLHELRYKLKFIEEQIEKDQYVDHQTCRWFYEFDTNSNSWTGKYYETKKEAQKSFELLY